MGLLNKFKNLFTEEVEEPVEEVKKEENIQKEVISVEIPSPTTRLEKHEIKEEPVKEEPEYKFPFFDDNEFENTYVKPEVKEKKERKNVYSPLKEEKRVFKPSPIISPVYGILDKGYKTESLTSKNDTHLSYYSSKEANVDAIRNKAYGGLEADIETTLFGDNHEEKLTEEVEKPKEEVEKPRHSAKDEDLTDLLEEEMGKTLELEKNKKTPRKISDQELFSLIDSMYDKEDKNDD